MVVDLREVNKRVEISAGSLPNLEQQTTWMQPGSRYFATLDALSGFDMLRTRGEDTKNFCISTPFTCFRLLEIGRAHV